ncbi:MAG: hypothetical protein EOP83_08770, partial [Verrucomicrobiaceae bacterium]
MKVDLSVGAGHQTQPGPIPDFVMITCTDASWMNQHLAKVVVPMLKCLKPLRQGVPREFNLVDEARLSGQGVFIFLEGEEEEDRVLEAGMEQWRKVIDEMIWAFEQYADMTG